MTRTYGEKSDVTARCVTCGETTRNLYHDVHRCRECMCSEIPVQITCSLTSCALADLGGNKDEVLGPDNDFNWHRWLKRYSKKFRKSRHSVMDKEM